MRRGGVLATALLLSCGADTGRVDSWYTPGHPSGPELTDMLAGDWKPLGKTLVHPVARERVKEAIGLLGDEPLLVLPREHAVNFLGPELPDTKRKKICLTRGVELNRSGTMRVYIKGDEVLVYFDARGGGGAMHRRPVIVLLEALPAKLWVGCSR